MLGPATTEMNWFCVCVEPVCTLMAKKYMDAAENILQDLRTCPPLPDLKR
ncbi:MAG: hypothetical protein Ct9H300mP28_31780 [Pseudomonadota bacterium]|nr:MAG: hypothetical protein Ct9H300mP28_31780 [Pseudomonadota bacterium]